MHYLILHNKNATIFVDTGTGAVINSHKYPTAVPKITKRMAEGIKGGAIREIEDEEAAKALIAEREAAEKKGAAPAEKSEKGKKTEPPVETTEQKLKKMNDEQLLAYYKENFTVSEEDAKAFGKMKTKEKIEFLLEDEE